MNKTTLRKQLLAQRGALPDRPQRTQALHQRLWAHLNQLDQLNQRDIPHIVPDSPKPELIVGAYWPIRGEWDPLPTLLAWQADPASASPLDACRTTPTIRTIRTIRTIALPVPDPQTHLLRFRQWTKQTPMKVGAYGIAEPLDSPEIIPHVLLIPCLGIHPQGFRLGYGGGFYDRTLAAWPGPRRPLTIGLGFSHGHNTSFFPEKHDIALDRALSEEADCLFSSSGAQTLL